MSANSEQVLQKDPWLLEKSIIDIVRRAGQIGLPEIVDELGVLGVAASRTDIYNTNTFLVANNRLHWTDKRLTELGVYADFPLP